MSATETILESEQTSALNSLPEHPLFEGLSDRHREILARRSMRVRFRRGEKVVETGETANCFYLILSGSIRLETPGGRKPLPIKTIGAGDILGWSWLFPPDFWHFDAIVSEPTEVIYFYGSQLRQECDTDQGLGYELFKRLAQRRLAGKSTLMTPDPEGEDFVSLGGEPENDPTPALLRPKLNVFALTVETADVLAADGTSTSTWWPKILFDSAKAAIRSAVGAPDEKTISAMPRA
ncbi:MAG TPA: Crp/Fnr family transcriptional regulator [Verrucomicrobiae bacterium]|jgi:hypothetical protein